MIKYTTSQEETQVVEILGSKFQCKVLGILDREDWIYASIEKMRFSEMLTHLSEVIVSIDDDTDVVARLFKMTNFNQVRKVIAEVHKVYNLFEDEAKNSDSSSESDTITKSSDAVTDVGEGKESVLKV